LQKQILQNTVVYYFDVGHRTTISKSEAKLRSKKKKGSQEKLISLSSPAAIKQLCLATRHCLVCRDSFTGFAKLFSNFNASSSHPKSFLGKSYFQRTYQLQILLRGSLF